MSGPSYDRLEYEEASYTHTTQDDDQNHSEITDSIDAIENKISKVSYFTLYRYASRKDKCYILIAILCSIICGCFTPYEAILLAKLLDSMINYSIDQYDGDFTADVLTFTVLSCVVGLSVVLLTYIATVAMNSAAHNQVYKIRQYYVKSVLSQDFEYFDKHHTGDIISKLHTDINKVEDAIGEKLAIFLYYQTSFFSCTIMAFIMGWKLALTCLAPFKVTLILIGISKTITSNLSRKESLATSKANTMLEEVVNSIRTVYAFNGQEKEYAKYEKHVNQVKNINYLKGFVNGLAMGILNFCVFGSYAYSFWYGYKLIIHDPERYDVIHFVAIFFGLLLGSANFGMSIMLTDVFGVATGAGAQIFNFIDRVPTINPLRECGVTPDFIEGNIELKNVTFYYPSRPEVPVLKAVNLTIKSGQTVAIVGPSGSGKSTILRLISRYYDVNEGCIFVDGYDTKNLSIRWLRAQIGLLDQEPVLFNTTIRENIRYGRQGATDADVETAARQSNAEAFICRLPQGYDTIVGENGTLLSSGQKQRIAIARTFIRNSQILLLDEATCGLDAASEVYFQNSLDTIRQGRTTIIVTHKLLTIRNVDIIYVLKNGTIVECGKHDELMQNESHYYNMVMLQTEIDKPKDNSLFESSLLDEQDNEVEQFESNTSFEMDDENKENNTNVSFWCILKLITPEWKIIAIASICSILCGFAMPALGVIFGNIISIISDYNTEKVIKELKTYTLTLLCIGIFLGVGNFIMVFSYSVAGETLTERIRITMFKNLLQQEMAFYDEKNNSSGVISAVLSDEAAAVQGGTAPRIATIMQTFGAITLAMIISFWYQWKVGLVALAFLSILAIILYMQEKTSNSEHQFLEASTKIAADVVSNIRTVVSLGREEYFLLEYSMELLTTFFNAKKSMHWRGFISGLSRGFHNFIYAGTIYYGAILIVEQKVNYSHVFISAQALVMGTITASQAFAFTPNFKKGMESARRVITLLKRKSKITDPIVPFAENYTGTGEAYLYRVKFRYPTRPSVPIFENLELNIDQGKTIALVGPNGCGKSTVLQLLERFYDPDKGIVAKDQYPLVKLRLVDVRRGIGLVQREPVLFDGTIRDNIAYGDNLRSPTMNEIVEAAKKAHIHQFIFSLPAGYHTQIGPRGVQLSVGQKQRIAIARALISQPKLLLLDEATSALDVENEKIVQQALKRAKARCTCVVVAHRLSTIHNADVIYVLKNGAVAESGTHDELISSKGLYYTLSVHGQT